MLIFDIGLLMKKFCYTRLAQYYLASQHLGSKKIRKIILGVLLIAGFSISSTASTCPEGIKPATTNDELVENAYFFVYNMALQNISILDIKNIECYFSDKQFSPYLKQKNILKHNKNNFLRLSSSMDINIEIRKLENKNIVRIYGNDKNFNPIPMINKYFQNGYISYNFQKNHHLDLLGESFKEKFFPRSVSIIRELKKETIIINLYYHKNDDSGKYEYEHNNNEFNLVLTSEINLK